MDVATSTAETAGAAVEVGAVGMTVGELVASLATTRVRLGLPAAGLVGVLLLLWLLVGPAAAPFALAPSHLPPTANGGGAARITPYRSSTPDAPTCARSALTAAPQCAAAVKAAAGGSSRDRIGVGAGERVTCDAA